MYCHAQASLKSAFRIGSRLGSKRVSLQSPPDVEFHFVRLSALPLVFSHNWVVLRITDWGAILLTSRRSDHLHGEPYLGNAQPTMAKLCLTGTHQSVLARRQHFVLCPTFEKKPYMNMLLRLYNS